MALSQPIPSSADPPPHRAQLADKRLAQLDTLLQKSATYVSLLKEQMEQARVRFARTRAKPKSAAAKSASSARRVASRKRARVVSGSEDERESKRAKAHDGLGGEGEAAAAGEKTEQPSFVQPVLLSGATLKDYQLEGVAWMAGLHGNGISGILGEPSIAAMLVHHSSPLSRRDGSREGVSPWSHRRALG